MNRCSLSSYSFILLTILSWAVSQPNSLVAEAISHKVDNSAVVVDAKKPKQVTVIVDEPQPPGVVLPSGLNFSTVTHAGFLETFQELVGGVHEGDAGLSTSQETTDALLGLAELYLAHAMIMEGQSIVVGLEGTALSQEQAARRAALSIALSVFDPWGMVMSEADILRLEAAEAWPKKALFRSLYHMKKDELEKARPFFGDVPADVSSLPDPIKEMVLPDLLSAAIDLEDWEAARGLAEMFLENENLKDGSAYHYLLGRTAENGQDYLVAFDYYIKSAQGLDRWAQLAGLSLVKMGMATKTLPLQDAHTLLSQIRFAWRGDAIAREVMDLLIQVELSLHDIPAALEVLGETIYINEDVDMVKAAKERSNLLLASYYKEGVSGKIPLTKFLDGHKRITHDYRFQEGFDLFSESFADRFLAIGASNEAAFEYETMYNYLSVAQDLGLFDVSSERLDQLRLKQVRALLRGGQYDLAEPILALGAQSTDPDIVNRFILLKAESFALNGNLQSIVDTQLSEPPIDYLRIKANAYFSMADWKNAAKTYHIIWNRMGNELLFTDTLNLFIAAYRNNDSALTVKLAKAFPSLTNIPQWQQIADWMVEKRDVVDVLQKDAIAADILNASRVLDVMKSINAPSQ